MKYAMVAVLFSAIAMPALAQDPGEAPDHGVARISFLTGEVNVQRGDSGELVAAELNAPLVARDHILTAQDSRAEVQLDWANFVRLASDSEVRMAELKDRDFLLQVVSGTMTFRVLRDSDSQVEISTPMVAIRPRLAGTYRITVRDDYSAEVTVRSGEAEIFAGNKTDFLRAGQTLLVSGDPSSPQRIYRAAIARDDWDRWNENRDHDLERSDSYKYVSRDIYGAEDLAGHGRWVYDSPYGWVWVPSVDAAWVPYRVGRWTWVDYYGWTWISGDPWGWAPYHYGRWYHAPSYGWVWYPGETRVRYYWRPALVSFFGWGVNVGWVSLAPYEIYRPWYGPGRTFVNNVTIVHNVNVLSSYRNARFISGRTGVTSVVSGDFGRRRVTANNFVAATDRDLSRAGDAGRWLQREPSRENRQFSDRQVSPRAAMHREPDRGFVSTRPDWNGVNHRDGKSAFPGGNERQAAGGNRERGDNAGQPRESARGGDGPRRGEGMTLPDQDRGRQGDPNRGRGQSSGGGTTAGQPPQTAGRSDEPRRGGSVTFPGGDQDRGRDGNPNRARGENSGGGTTAGQPPQTAGRTDGPRRGEGVTFPGGDQDRARQGDSNRGRTDTSAGNVGTSPGNARRNDAPPRNDVTFPRESDRARQPDADRRTAGNNTAGAVFSSRNAGRPEGAPRNEAMVAFPRQEPDRGNQSGNNSRGRSEGFARRDTNEVSRATNPNPETFRRQEPVGRVTSPDPGSVRSSSSRTRPEEVQPRAPENSPSRGPERERSHENSPAPRVESRNSAPAPQASSSGSSSGSSGHSSDHSRGRDRH
jgi:hypothetical protein